MITSSFWRERRVFVTGHTGFKGAWLALVLERLNARVTGYGLEPAVSPSLYELARVGDGLCDVRGDVSDAAMLDGALRAADPEIVIHMATRAPRGALNPGDPRAHVEGDRAVIEACEVAPSLQAALVVSPDGHRVLRRGRARRGDPLVFSVDCPDPTGGGDFAPRRRSSDGGPALHVLDALYGLLLLAETAFSATAPMPREYRFARESGRIALARNETIGFAPLLDLAEAEFWTAEWRRACEGGADMRAITLDQIDGYLGQRVRLTSPFADMLSAPAQPARHAIGA